MSGSERLRRERHLEAARGYLALEMPRHALTELDAVDDPGKSPFVYHQLRGEALRQTGAFVEALAEYDLAQEIDPTDLTVLLGKAWCYKRTGRLPLSIATMEQARKACPSEPIVVYNLACYHALAGDKVRALSWLGRALRMESSLRKLIPGESDFDLLRADKDFQFVVSLGDSSRHSR